MQSLFELFEFFGVDFPRSPSLSEGEDLSSSRCWCKELDELVEKMSKHLEEMKAEIELREEMVRVRVLQKVDRLRAFEQLS
ncbi:hypothetical protein GCK32_019923, partial [Trichostrongylus colubriformis]